MKVVDAARQAGGALKAGKEGKDKGGKGGSFTGDHGVKLAGSAVQALSSGLDLLGEKEKTEREVVKAQAEVLKSGQGLQQARLLHEQQMGKLRLQDRELLQKHAEHGDKHALNVDKFKDNVRNRGDVMAMLRRKDISPEEAIGLLEMFKD